MKRITPVLAALLIGMAGGSAVASHAPGHAAEAKANDALVDGEVRKVDKEAGKVTIKHGPLVALDMPAMTMVFRVKDPAMLDKLKAGDSIKFKAEKNDGALTVTEYQTAK